MRSLVSRVLEFRFLVVVIAAILMIFGIMQFRQMPIDVLPEFSRPTIEIQTEALGLSAQEVDELITLGMEQDLLNGVPWLDTIESESLPGLSSIVLTFMPGTDLNRARQMVAERMAQAFALPHVSKPPVMLQPKSSTSRVMMVALSSKNLSLIQMSVLARWTITPRLLGVPGVSNVATWGQRDRQLQVQVDPQMLKDNKLSLLQTLETTGNALWVSSLSFLEASTPGTGGFVESPTQRLGIRHILPIVSPEGLIQVPFEESSAQLGDIAKVVEGNQPLIGDAITNDGPSLLLVIDKFPGANTRDVTSGVEAALESMRPGLGGIDINTDVYRTTDFIDLSLSNVSRALLIGLVLLALVLAAFFFSWRTLVVSFVAIPLSILVAGLVLYLRGATVNIFTIAGFAIALGVLIDEAISDVNHIVQRLRQEDATKSSARVIVDTVLEMRITSLYAIVILLLVLAPIFFMEGQSGVFFQPLILSYALAVVASLIVALIVTPALYMLFLGHMSRERSEPPLIRWFVGLYQSILRPIITQPRAMWVTVVIITLVGLGTLFVLKPALTLAFQEPNVLVQLTTAPGTSQPEVSRITGLISQEIQGVQGVRSVAARVGRAVQGDQMVNINTAELSIGIDMTSGYDQTIANIRHVLRGYAGVRYKVETYLQQVSDQLLAQPGNTLVVRVFGDRPDTLRTQADQVKQAVTGISGISNASIDLPLQEPTLEIEVNLDLAKQYGLKPGDVRRAATTFMSGIQVGNLFEEQKVFDVVVWSTPETRNSVSSVSNLLINTPSGGSVRLGDVAKVSIVPSDSIIRHDAVKRYLDVVVDVEGRDRAAVANDINGRLKDIQFPLEYYAEVLGSFSNQQTAQTGLITLAIAAAIGIFFLLQAAYRSWRLALISFLTLPSTVVGALVITLITGGGISVGLLGGILAVFAISLRSQLLLFSDYHRLTKDKQGEFDLAYALEGASGRLPSVVITAFATALVFLPALLMGKVAGLEILQPLAISVIGALITAVLINIFVLPSLYLAARVPFTEELDLGLEEASSTHESPTLAPTAH